MNDIKIGDVVKLKSGGPEMTVGHMGFSTADSGIIDVECYWFPSPHSEQQAECRTVFPIHVLKLVSKHKIK